MDLQRTEGTSHPFVRGLLAQMMSTFSASSARLNWARRAAFTDVHTEDVVFITMERDWFAMCLHLGTRRPEIVEGRF